MDFIYSYLPWILIVVGVMLALKAKKRKFDRTNQHGVEQFPSFWVKLRARTVDFVLTGFSALLLAAGVIALAYGHLDTWGWIIIAPIMLFMLFLMIGN